MKKIGAIHSRLFVPPAGSILSSIVSGTPSWLVFLFHNLFMTWSKIR
jgi:hypothetical protein